MIFKFLWNGTDKVTRVSTINEYSEGGLKMIDLECMVKSLRLAWLERIFNNNDGIWKRYLGHKLQPFGGLFFMNCNYDIKDYIISSQFYHELLSWWSEFRETFASEKDWENIIWNNREICIDKKNQFFYKNYFDCRIVFTHNLLLDLDNRQSYSIFSKTIKKTNFLQWAGLRHSIPTHLKGTNKSPSITALTFLTEYNVFDVVEKKSKDYYSLLVGKKAQPPYIVHTPQRNFNISSDQIKHFFILPHRVALESYVKAFQYKVLTSILYTNTKLHKIGFRPNDLCSFCKAQSETLSHFFYHCSHSRHFWTDFESYWLFLSNQRVHLSLENVLYGIISQQCPLLNLLNYFQLLSFGNCFCGTAEEAKLIQKLLGLRTKLFSSAK